MNRKLHLLTRAKMSVLNAIRTYGDTEAEEHFQSALHWINAAINLVKHGASDGSAMMINATTHLQTAARVLGHEPIKITA